jgi:pimeloyl-ACP methyl ester carboxylesterase
LRGHYDTLEAARQADLPALVIHGGRDGIIPVGQGERVATALGSRARWVRVDQAGHNDLLMFPIVWQELERFFAAIAG